jgi:hypothetical protein
MVSRLLLQRTGRDGWVATAFLILAAAALSILLLRPVCEVLFAHAVAAQHPADCCASLGDGAALEPADLATPASGGEALPARVGHLLGNALLPVLAAARFTSPVLPARSYYTRSSRILR